MRGIVWRRVADQRPVTVVTASDLLACPETDRSTSGCEGDVAIPEGMLADLHHPRLVITDAYVGPDRRTLDRGQRRAQRRDEQRRREWRPGSEFPPPRAARTPVRRTSLVVATVATAVTVAPLTLVVAHLAGH